MTDHKISRKIELLNTLINHPRTSEAERAAAHRMIARLMAKNGADTAPAPVDHRWYGEKYDHDCRLSTVDIAKLIREDIKVARKVAKMAAAPGAVAVADPIADAPAEIKFSVKSQYFAGGSSIDVYVKSVPAGWGFAEQEDPRWPGHMETRPTTALRALAAELKAIMDAYNHDGSDSMTDHYDVRFYGSVMNEGGLILA